jgi:hypothetical protein
MPASLHEIEQMLELRLGFTGKAGDEGAADDKFRAHLAPALDTLQIALAAGGAFHAPQHVGMAVLERDIQVRQDLAGRHEGNDVVHARIRIDVVQPHPGPVGLGNVAKCLHQFKHPRLDRLAVPEAGSVTHIDAIGRRVLADDQQFLHAAFEQGLASFSTSPTGRLTRSPRMEGMMQNVQRWLQPSLIFRYA